MARPNYVTPAGLSALKESWRLLFEEERPKLVETISWAAANGDRSENGDYIYGRKRLREIDRELKRLSERLKQAVMVDPSVQPDRTRAFFGATVVYVDEQERRRTVRIVGEDETDAARGAIGWTSPVARALHGASVGDLRLVRLPSGEQEIEVVEISYPEC